MSIMHHEPDPHQGQNVVCYGPTLQEATSAMILLHGRGATASSILDLGRALPREGMVYLAPQALGNTWYPHSFLAPRPQNEPGISSGLKAIAALVERLHDANIPSERIVLGGFSQGACLVSDFVARHPARYGAALIFSGGLIGPLDTPLAYAGDLRKTPIFLGCSDTDFHIPLWRVRETAAIFEGMGADVLTTIYPGMGHTIVQEEMDTAKELLDDHLM
jgi:predicted esterase